MEDLKKQKKEDNEHLSDYCFEFDTSAKSRFFTILFNQLYNICFGNFFLLVRNRTNHKKILIEKSKFNCVSKNGVDYTWNHFGVDCEWYLC